MISWFNNATSIAVRDGQTNDLSCIDEAASSIGINFFGVPSYAFVSSISSLLDTVT